MTPEQKMSYTIIIDIKKEISNDYLVTVMYLRLKQRS